MCEGLAAPYVYGIIKTQRQFNCVRLYEINELHCINIKSDMYTCIMLLLVVLMQLRLFICLLDNTLQERAHITSVLTVTARK